MKMKFHFWRILQKNAAHQLWMIRVQLYMKMFRTLQWGGLRISFCNIHPEIYFRTTPISVF